MTETIQAVFVRIEGVLTGRGVRAAAAYFAANAAGLRERVLFPSQGTWLATAPIYEVLGQERSGPPRIWLAYLALRGMSEDRIAELHRASTGRTVAASHQLLEISGVELNPARARRGQARGVVGRFGGRGGQAAGRTPALRRRLRLVQSSELFAAVIATGKLRDPVIGGHDGGRFVETYAREHGIDLAASSAYGAHGPDVLMLAAVGRPCAVNPDYTLRRAAREAGWPVMDYHV